MLRLSRLRVPESEFLPKGALEVTAYRKGGLWGSIESYGAIVSHACWITKIAANPTAR
jgi:hypothetical protein